METILEEFEFNKSTAGFGGLPILPKQVDIEETKNPENLKSFKGHSERITRIEFNPNLKQLVSTGNDAVVYVWNYKKNSRPYVFKSHKGSIYALSVNPSGNTIATGSADKTIRIWNNSMEGYNKLLKSHTGPVRDICFSCDGQLLLSCSDDKTLRMWNISENKFLATISAHKNWVRTCHINSDATILISGSDDTSIKLWDSIRCEEIAKLTEHTGMINSVRFHPDGSCIASGATDNTIKLWDARSQRLLQHYDAHTKAVNSISFHPTGNFLISTSQDATVKIWDLRQGSILYTLYGHDGITSAATFSTYGGYFATGGQDTIIQIWKSNLDDSKVEYIESLENKFAPETKIINSKDSEVPAATKNDFEEEPRIIEALPQRESYPAPEQQKQIAVDVPKTKILDYDEIPVDFRTTLDKMVYHLDLVSKTVCALEKRLTFSEDKMSEVVEYFKNLDSEGNYRDIEPSAIIKNSEIIKNITPDHIKRIIEFNDKQKEMIKVRPDEDVDDTFMRETNQFITISRINP